MAKLGHLAVEGSEHKVFPHGKSLAAADCPRTPLKAHPYARMSLQQP